MEGLDGSTLHLAMTTAVHLDFKGQASGSSGFIREALVCCSSVYLGCPGWVSSNQQGYNLYLCTWPSSWELSGPMKSCVPQGTHRSSLLLVLGYREAGGWERLAPPLAGRGRGR